MDNFETVENNGDIKDEIRSITTCQFGQTGENSNNLIPLIKPRDITKPNVL